MGVAIRIPHSKDEGAYWIRVIVEMEFMGNTISVTVGDDKLRNISIEYSKADVASVQEMIFTCARDTMEESCGRRDR